ncbi:MAG TPA: hypothetical protein PKM19_07250, partial [Pseudomonadales bacterium]|nr:hypothetical protein [Pseudomonadales bacterium]
RDLCRCFFRESLGCLLLRENIVKGSSNPTSHSKPICVFYAQPLARQTEKTGSCWLSVMMQLPATHICQSELSRNS